MAPLDLASKGWYHDRNGLYGTMKIITKQFFDGILDHTSQQCKSIEDHIFGEGRRESSWSGLPQRTAGKPNSLHRCSCGYLFLGLPHEKPLHKTVVVLLHQLLTALDATAARSVLTHFPRVNLNISWQHIVGVPRVSISLSWGSRLLVRGGPGDQIAPILQLKEQVYNRAGEDIFRGSI